MEDLVSSQQTPPTARVCPNPNIGVNITSRYTREKSAIHHYLAVCRTSEPGRAGADRAPVPETELQPADTTRPERQRYDRSRLRDSAHPAY